MSDKLSIQELAEAKGISSKTVWRWVRHGYGKQKIKLHAERVGHQYRVNPNTWQSFLYRIAQ